MNKAIEALKTTIKNLPTNGNGRVFNVELKRDIVENAPEKKVSKYLKEIGINVCQFYTWKNLNNQGLLNYSNTIAVHHPQKVRKASRGFNKVQKARIVEQLATMPVKERKELLSEVQTVARILKSYKKFK
ncbi:MAG: hypothetical protein GWN01_15025 [Nitrosopumilaceae archaeon]|nr:hypothetical protein [Nitrosopumilaceae archaeon]NIU88564.1 hypothetical protein [Nitrosopumilaceae archaeon]NIV66782.1 hypothetical protein [Nitrosopumilaceae archaeon]NIX62762.1 hypothetical protein [Nitrosopumilaceae archaeon]